MARSVTYLLFLSFVFNQDVHGQSFKKAIDDYIHNLSYSSDEILSFKGETIRSVPFKGEIKEDDPKCIVVIKREKRTAANSKADIGVVGSNQHVTFPGALLLANVRFMDNNPTMVVLGRASLTYTVNLPGLEENGNFDIIPNFANYYSNKERILNMWFDKAKDYIYQEVNSEYQSESAFAYSKEYLSVRFGMEFNNIPISTDIEFEAMKKDEKLIMVYQFKQIFYTVSVQPVQKPSDLFAPEVTLEDVKRKVDNDKPPVIVDTVSYGRVIYIKLETSSTGHEAKNILKVKDRIFFNTENQNQVQEKLENVNMQVYVLGGSTEQVSLIRTRSLAEVHRILVNYSKFSRENPGYPISHSAQFIKDHARAIVNMSTDYIDVTRTKKCQGIVRVVHKGWFVMKWHIDWIEITYDEDGNEKVEKKSWEKNGELLFAPFEADIELPGNADDISVVAKEATTIKVFWDPWRTVIKRSNIDLIGSREFSVWGVTLFPRHKITPPL